jgi:hypothetical protein
MFILKCQSLCHQAKSEKLAGGKEEIAPLGYKLYIEPLAHPAGITTDNLTVLVLIKFGMLTLVLGSSQAYFYISISQLLKS